MINFLLDCNDSNLRIILNLVKTIINLIKFGVPILLIIFGMLDLGKAVMAGKEDEMKKFQGALIKRFIYAVVVFLVVVLVQFVLGIVADTGADTGSGELNWYQCLYGSGSDADPAG